MNRTKTCNSTGKRQYSNWQRANLEAQIVTAFRGGGTLRAYQCSNCKSWHIGRVHKRKWRTR